jgi:hypothetical protein
VGTIIPFLRDGVALRDGTFERLDTDVMSRALADACQILDLRENHSAKKAIAARVLDLALQGEKSPTRLRDILLREAGVIEHQGFTAPLPLAPDLVPPNTAAPPTSTSAASLLPFIKRRLTGPSDAGGEDSVGCERSAS